MPTTRWEALSIHCKLQAFSKPKPHAGFPVALQNTVQLSYDLGDLATVSWEDWGRDLPRNLDWKQCGLRLAELGAMGGGIYYAKVSRRLPEFEADRSEGPTLKRVMKQTLKYLERRKM